LSLSVGGPVHILRTTSSDHRPSKPGVAGSNPAGRATYRSQRAEAQERGGGPGAISFQAHSSRAATKVGRARFFRKNSPIFLDAKIVRRMFIEKLTGLEFALQLAHFRRSQSFLGTVTVVVDVDVLPDASVHTTVIV
jgi:hypothetical protein